MKNVTRRFSGIIMFVSLSILVSGCFPYTEEPRLAAQERIRNVFMGAPIENLMEDTSSRTVETTAETRESSRAYVIYDEYGRNYSDISDYLDTMNDDYDGDNSYDETAITTSDDASVPWPDRDLGPIKNVFPKITLVLTGQRNTVIDYEGLSKSAAERYITDLRCSGFSFDENYSYLSTMMFSADDWQGNHVEFSYFSDGTGSVSYQPCPDDQ